MNDAPLVSVIMPCYNASTYITDALMSIKKQTHRHIEVIIIDDGSTDNTCKVVQIFAEENEDITIHIYCRDHYGAYPARNYGLKHAHGKYVAFLDADDLWHEDCIQTLLLYLLNNNSDLSYCGWRTINNQTGSDTTYIPPVYENGDIVKHFLQDCPWPIHAVLVKRSILEKLGGFSERCYSAMDYDLWMRLLTITDNIIHVPKVLAYYRWHDAGQISDDKLRQISDAIRARTDFINSYPDLISHIDHKELFHIVHGQYIREAYNCYWKRDIYNAQKLFRVSFIKGACTIKDMKYVIPSFLPTRIYNKLITMADRYDK